MEHNSKINPRDGLTYVWIPPGTFQMGFRQTILNGTASSCPAHQETVTRGFWLGQTPVTQRAYERVMGENPSYFKGPELPVESVTWDEAQSYSRAIGGRLPTEVEWEYAARAGTTGPRYGELDNIASHTLNSGNQTWEVGRKQPNAFKLCDMLGNVWEWTTDRDGPPGTTSGQSRLLRGGSWTCFPWFVRASSRNADLPDDRSNDIGFRCVWE